MLKKIIIFIIGISFLLPTSLYANDVGNLAKSWFSDFSIKISKKYNNDKEIVYFEAFNEKLNELLATKDFNEMQEELINDLIKLANERVFKLSRQKEESKEKIKIKTNELVKDFKNISYNKENIFLEDGIWYFYDFKDHLVFPEEGKVRIEDLEYNGIYKDKALVFLREDNKLGFAINYTKTKLISDEIIYGIAGKYNFLKELKNDKRYIKDDTDEYFKKLKKETLELTKNKTKEDKIKLIYNYILENIEYTNSFKLTDYEIFSGILTYNNKNGVCDGYTKLFLYMLNFSKINHSEVIRGYVIDARDFPQVGHAWIKIGDYYYDPTFDDPLGQIKTRSFNDYFYYKIPFDLFYTNRYTFENTPEELKTKSLEYRERLVRENMKPLVYKYRYSSYNIVKPLVLRLENGIDLEKDLTILDLEKIFKSAVVENFKLNLDGKNKTISNLKYYIVNESKIEDLLKQINYTTYNYYLFKWKLDNGNYEYRLSYDVEFK